MSSPLGVSTRTICSLPRTR
ncbi:unnamed protein product [Medioppia subpectinata]|uniref:Uncharacterized protein n=1 Tax=Medioppia subpectinata TaxID=1979941 RepID=A0A7R9QFU1_9ACAR|nr:unnamed protein product [Medioppia subpectinata]CAG2120052.1 unnamed protein product [Medioppia subpectinata]